MNIPSFSAELSLYKSTAYYLPLRSSALPMNNAVKPMMIAEEIEVFGCAPGLLQLGEGPNMSCLNPNDLFGGGGGGGSPTVPLDDGPHGPGGGPVKPPRPPKVRPGPPSKAKCQSQCKDLNSTSLDWSVACDEYCHCLWETPNSAKVCGKDFMEDTGAKKPPFG